MTLNDLKISNHLPLVCDLAERFECNVWPWFDPYHGIFFLYTFFYFFIKISSAVEMSSSIQNFRPVTFFLKEILNFFCFRKITLAQTRTRKFTFTNVEMYKCEYLQMFHIWRFYTFINIFRFSQPFFWPVIALTRFRLHTVSFGFLCIVSKPRESGLKNCNDRPFRAPTNYRIGCSHITYLQAWAPNIKFAPAPQPFLFEIMTWGFLHLVDTGQT